MSETIDQKVKEHQIETLKFKVEFARQGLIQSVVAGDGLHIKWRNAYVLASDCYYSAKGYGR